MEPLVLVVMENGSEWPVHLAGTAAGCVVLRQETGEDEGALLRRTYDRVRAIERSGRRVCRAVLSCSDDGRPAALEARVPLARALLATVLRAGGDGRMDLVGRSKARPRVRSSLVALAGTLTEALAGTTATVSLRFADGPSEAGRQAA